MYTPIDIFFNRLCQISKKGALEAGVPEEMLKQTRRLHDQAHIYWEWWTAENSDGFHNPEAARESLARSIYFE